MGSRMGVSGREHSTRDEALNEVLQGKSVWVGRQPFSPGGSGARSGGLHGRDRALAGGRAHDVTACGTHAPRASKRCSHRSALPDVRAGTRVGKWNNWLCEDTERWYKNVPCWARSQPQSLLSTNTRCGVSPSWTPGSCSQEQLLEKAALSMFLLFRGELVFYPGNSSGASE